MVLQHAATRSNVGSNAIGHEMKVIMPAVSAGLCLIRIPLGVAVLLLLGGTGGVILVVCGSDFLQCLFGLGRFLGRGGLGAVLRSEVLAALAPEARPGLVPGLAAGFHVVPLLATRFHCGRLGGRGLSCQSKNGKGGTKCHKGGTGFHGFLLTVWATGQKMLRLASLGLTAASPR